MATSKLPKALLARRIHSVTPAVADAVWPQMDNDGVSRHPQAKAKNVLSKAWQMAMRLDWVPSNPWTVARPKPPG